MPYADPVKQKEYFKEYYQRNNIKIRVARYYKEWRKNKIAQLQKYHKEWRIKNKEYIKICGKNYRATHKEEFKKIHAIWRGKNKLRLKVYNHRRRFKNKALKLEVLQMVYEDNIKKYGTLHCVLCNMPIIFGDDTLEHLTPLSRGGTNDYNNLAIAHRICNSRKNNKTMSEWERYCG